MRFFLVLFLPLTLAAQSVPTWQITGEVEEGKDVSGAVLVHGGKLGVLVSDETRGVQSFVLDAEKHSIAVGEYLPLRPNKGKELDLESVCTASTGGGVCYAIGSHGVSRKDGSIKPDRLGLFRFTVGPEGRLTALAETTLFHVLAALPELKDSLGKRGGIDIEGMAEREGLLWVGLRSPTHDGNCFVLELAADSVFADAKASTAKVHRLALGAARGIREIVRVADGFFVLAGPAVEEQDENGYSLHHWKPSGELVRLGSVPTSEGKAEGLLVLEESAERIRLLVFFDGIAGGGPVEMSLAK